MDETARWIAAYPDLDAARHAIETVDRVGDVEARVLEDDAAFDLAFTAHLRRVPRLRPYRFSVASLLGTGLGAALGALVGVGVDVLVAPGSRTETVGLVVGGAFGLVVAWMMCILDRIGERHATRLTDDEMAPAPDVDGVWIGVRTRSRDGALQATTLELLEDTGPLLLTELPTDGSVI
jgi:hypothetical protein